MYNIDGKITMRSALSFILPIVMVVVVVALIICDNHNLQAQTTNPNATVTTPAGPAAPVALTIEDQARVRALQAEALSAESAAKQLFNNWLLTEDGRKFSEINQRAVQFNGALEMTIKNLQTKYGANGYELRSSPDGSSLVWVKQ
jgi:hypothetical protein